MLFLIVMVLFLSSITVELIAVINSARAVKGSRERYVWLTVRRIASWSTIAFIFMYGIVDIITQSYAFAGIQFFIGTFSAIQELKRKDDDDWFNGRWKKIKAGAKKLAKKAKKALTPKPINVPLPNPV